MGAWQRVQLVGLLISCDRAFASTEGVAARLRRAMLGKPVLPLPVGSNLPDMSSRPIERAELGVPDETLLVALFGTGHPSRLLGYAVEAIRAVAATGRKVVALNLGAGAPPLAGLDESIRVLAPGLLEPSEVARRLAAADLFLAPWEDGASTRRGTLMAALQHGLPVVTTDGPLTGSMLRDSGAIALAPVDRPELFVRIATSLAGDPAARHALGKAGRELYDSAFDWPVIASRLLDACRAPGHPSATSSG